MKRFIPIALACVMVVSLVLCALSVSASANNNPLEVNDFENATVGSAVSIGDIAGGLTVTATDELVGNGSIGVVFDGANDGASRKCYRR